MFCASFKSSSFEKTEVVSWNTFLPSFPSMFFPSHLANFYSSFRSLFHPFFPCKAFLIYLHPANVRTTLMCSYEHCIVFHTIVTNYSHFWLFAVVLFYKAAMNTELVNTERTIVLRGNTELTSCESLVPTFSLINM